MAVLWRPSSHHRFHRPRHLQLLRFTPFVAVHSIDESVCACAHASSAYRTTIQRKTSFYTWLKHISLKKLAWKMDEREDGGENNSEMSINWLFASSQKNMSLSLLSVFNESTSRLEIFSNFVACEVTHLYTQKCDAYRLFLLFVFLFISLFRFIGYIPPSNG